MKGWNGCYEAYTTRYLWKFDCFELVLNESDTKHHLGHQTIHQMLLNEIILNSKTRTYPENQR